MPEFHFQTITLPTYLCEAVDPPPSMDLSDAVIFNTTRLKSEVWNDFDRLKKGDMLLAICRHCKKTMSGMGTSGTSHLRNHLLRCQARGNNSGNNSKLTPSRGKKRGRPPSLGNASLVLKKDEELPLAEFDGQLMDVVAVASPSFVFDQRRSEFDLARMIILHGYPMTMVEDVGFKTFIKNMQPLFEFMASTKVEADCFEIYEKEKQKLFEVLDKLPRKICLNVDVWSCSDKTKYFGLVAHFIDDAWRLKKTMLNFLRIDAFQTEDMQADAIMKCLMDWDIDRKLFSMTWDGCSTANNIVSRIKDRLSENKFLYGGGLLFDVHCLGSVLNQMAEVAMETVSEVVPKIREAIQHIKSSKEMQEKFTQMATRESTEYPKSLTLDSRFRWDSTFRMLEAAIEYKAVFSQLLEGDSLSESCPSDEEWERVGSVTGFLNVFLDFINEFTRSINPTTSIYFPLACDVFLKLKEWSESSDDFIASLAATLRGKFDIYWEKCGLTLSIATFLDPRFKMKMVEYYFPQMFGDSGPNRVDEVRDRIKALYNEHAIGSPLASDDEGLIWQVGGGGAGGGSGSSKDRLSGFEKFLDETSETVGVKSDLDKYIEEPLFPRNVDFNILNWWKVHHPRYPILSMMAQNILPIQITKVSPETAFDRVGKALDRDRSALNSATLQVLMCSQDWIGTKLES